MKKLDFVLRILFSFFLLKPLIAQQKQPSNEDETSEILLDDFETKGTWSSYLGHTRGYSEVRTLEGSPKEKSPINWPDGTINLNSKVLGIKTNITARGKYSLFLSPYSPIQIPGIVKTLKIWVNSRNIPNTLYAIIRDAKGRIHWLPFQDESGSNYLAFTWKQLRAIISDGQNGVRQKEYIHSRDPFVSVISLAIQFYINTTNTANNSDKEQFIYLDDLIADSDIYTQNILSEDSITNRW